MTRHSLTRRELLVLAGVGSAAAIAAACQSPTGGPAASGAAASPRSGGSIVIDPGQELTLIDPQQNPGNQTIKNLTNNFSSYIDPNTCEMKIRFLLRVGQIAGSAVWNANIDMVGWTVAQ